METLNSFLKRLETFADNHKQINKFGFGLESDISAEEEAYTLLWVDVDSVDYYENYKTMYFTMLIVDIQRDNQSNVKDTLNDNELITSDLVKYLMSSNFNDFELNITNSATKVREVLPDVLNGWRLNCSINIITDNNLCDIPFN